MKAHTKEMPLSCLQHAPVNIRNRIALIDGVLYISDELRGSPELVSFLSLARRHGLTEYKFPKAADFDRNYKHGVHKLKTDSEIQAYAINLMAEARKLDASDIHIIDYGTFGMIQIRRLGMLQDYSHLQAEEARKLIRAIYQTMSSSSDAQFSPTERQDGRIVKRDYLPDDVHSVRLHTEPLECVGSASGTGTFMAMRLLYDRTNASGTVEERVGRLGYTPAGQEKIRFLCDRSGLTIISGPTGHGKSTLLKHIMEAQAHDQPEKSYSSIEDPPEYPLENVKQILVNTKDKQHAGDHKTRGAAYINAIAGAMRADPDVIMIGEIRYPEAASAAIDAALTGHAVWATLHANNALGIIKRMTALLRAAQVEDPLEYLCDHNVIAGLIYQRLIPTLCPDCRVRWNDESQQKHIDKVFPKPVRGRLMRVISDMSGVYVRGLGCERCKKLGILDQTVASEIIVTDQILLEHLRSGRAQEAYNYWLDDQGGQTYVAHAIDLISNGLADPNLTEVRIGVPLDFDQILKNVIKNRSAA